MDHIQQARAAFEKVLDFFEHELSTLRTGRANAALLSTVIVESYGATMPLSNVASVTVSDAKTLTISPWDKSQMSAIEKGIIAANLGLNPSSDGVVIRITIPPMTEDRRREMVKLVGQMAEKARIGIRKDREEVLKKIKNEESEGMIGKDEAVGKQRKLQEVVDEYNDKIKSIAEAKEEEVMTV